jgi:hypothetical protein
VVPTQTSKKSVCHNAGTAGTDMATIRRRKSRWQVQIRRQGHQLSRTFRLRADAELWSRQLEAELDRGGLPMHSRMLRAHTLADLLRRYEAEVVPRKRSADREVYMLRVILRHPVARVSLHLLTTTEIAKYRDYRLALVKSDAVRRELAIVRHCIEVARKEWGFVLPSNPNPAGQNASGRQSTGAEGAPGRIRKATEGLRSLTLSLASRRYPTGRRDGDATERVACDAVGRCGP